MNQKLRQDNLYDRGLKRKEYELQCRLGFKHIYQGMSEHKHFSVHKESFEIVYNIM